jgi:hypothetical protein
MTAKSALDLDQRRRAALAKLGLMAVAAYAAPVVTRLDQGRAAVPSHHCPPGQAACGGPSNNKPKPKR